MDLLLADPSKARQRLNWEPRVKFRELVRIMVDADLEEAGLQPMGEGRRILREKFENWHQWTSSVSNVFSAAVGRALGEA